MIVADIARETVNKGADTKLTSKEVNVNGSVHHL